MASKIDYSKIGAVCRRCAKKAGFTPKPKAVAVWVGECGVCHKNKTCTNLWHDWDPPPGTVTAVPVWKTTPVVKAETKPRKAERNALAELAERMRKYIADAHPQWSFRGDATAAMRIIAELAKVKTATDLVGLIGKCRAIAEE